MIILAIEITNNYIKHYYDKFVINKKSLRIQKNDFK